MNRQEKQDLLARLSEMYKENDFVFLVAMNAVNAANAINFRAEVRKCDAECMVIKNTLSKIAAKKANVEAFDKHLNKQVLTIFANNPVEVAKILKAHKASGYTALIASDKGNIVSASDIEKLAEVPSMPVLRGMLLSTLLGVQRKTVRLLSEYALKLSGSATETTTN